MLCAHIAASVTWLGAGGTAEGSFGVSLSWGLARVVLEQLWPPAVALVGL